MPVPRFLGPAAPPDAAALAERVGKAMGPVHAALAALGGRPGQVAHTWHFSETSDWYLTYDRGSKRLFHLFPKEGGLLLKLVYNAAGVQALQAAQLPAFVRDKLEKAKTCSEGTVLEFTARELTTALLTDLLRIKAASLR